jgi:hypothetical protein
MNPRFSDISTSEFSIVNLPGSENIKMFILQVKLTQVRVRFPWIFNEEQWDSASRKVPIECQEHWPQDPSESELRNSADDCAFKGRCPRSFRSGTYAKLETSSGSIYIRITSGALVERETSSRSMHILIEVLLQTELW